MQSSSSSIMRDSSRLLVGAILGGALLVGADASAYTRTGAAEVSFHAKGTAGMQLVGKTSELELKEEGDHLLIRVPLANLDTGIALRNRHMREKYLEVARFPTADLRVAKADLAIPSSGEHAGNAAGQFSLHGVTRPTKVAYRAVRTAHGWHVTGTLHVQMNDHGITIPSYFGVTVQPDVDVQVAFDAAE